MKVNPYLGFSGQCEEALKFYAESLGGTIDGMMKYAGSPAEQHAPAGWGDKILHARLVVEDNVIMASDGPRPDPTAANAKPVTVAIGLNDAAKGERIFNALSAGGKVDMPFQKTFWSNGFGMCTDRFGIPWMINCE